MIKMKKKSKNTIYKQISILIVWTLIIATSLSIQYGPSVEASLPGPHNVLGYINNSSDQAIPSGQTVTLTDLNNSNTDTTTTGASGSYSLNVGLNSVIDADDGDWIVVNCSYNGEVNENLTIIDANNTYSWCNLTGGTRLETENLSISLNDSAWDPGDLSIGASSYNATSDTAFNLTNEGNIKINVRISGENITFNGASYTWYINETTSIDNYTLQFKKSGGASWTPINYSNLSFVTDLQYNSDYFTYTYWQQFGLNITMPTSSSKSDTGELSTNITFWSIKA
jgi:hypothetical protein